MTAFEGFLITGLVTGCIYALIAMGLVVTYTTTGIFNFSHGAIAMVAAYMFWQLWQGWGLNVIVAFVLVLLVIAPLFGLLIEAALMRPLTTRTAARWPAGDRAGSSSCRGCCPARSRRAAACCWHRSSS